MANYQYLVNSLPDIVAPDIDQLKDIRSVIEDNLDAEGTAAFRYLLYRNDNKNLLKLMRKRDGILPKAAESFYAPAVFSFEDLDDMLIDKYEDDANVPEYMQQFLEEERHASWTVRAREIRLLELYYDAGTSFQQEFIRSMCLFKRDLKNILLALNARMHGFKIASITVGDYDLPAMLAAATQADFGLTGVYEYIPLLSALLVSGKLLELEKTIDALLLQRCEAIAGENLFTLNYVLYYFLEISLRHRWQFLSADSGARALAEHIEQVIHTAGRSAETRGQG